MILLLSLLQAKALLADRKNAGTELQVAVAGASAVVQGEAVKGDVAEGPKPQPSGNPEEAKKSAADKPSDVPPAEIAVVEGESEEHDEDGMLADGAVHGIGSRPLCIGIL